MAKRVLSEKAMANRRAVDERAQPLVERFNELDARVTTLTTIAEAKQLQVELRAWRCDLQVGMRSCAGYLGRFGELDYSGIRLGDNIAGAILSGKLA